MFHTKLPTVWTQNMLTKHDKTSHTMHVWYVWSLKLTANFAPKNGWLEYYFPIGFWPIFKGENVSFREGIYLLLRLIFYVK